MVLIFRQHILALWPVGDNRCKSTKVTLQTHLVRRLSTISVTCLHISILLKRIFCGTMAALGQAGPGGVPAFPPASIERAMDRNYNSNQAAGTQNTSSRSPTASSTPAERRDRVASTAQTERDNGVNDRDRDPNPGYFGGSGQSTSSVNRDNEANRIAAQNEAAKRAQQGQIVKNKDQCKKNCLGNCLRYRAQNGACWRL
jgi:hypothetical protein